MQVSKQNLKSIHAQPGLVIPDEKLLALPEKVLQFGTGVLLRGLPDYFIDKANRNGIFNGRIVVVKSTDSAGTDKFLKQDCLYTLCVRGVEDEKKIDETIINSSISRVLEAKEDWNTILKCAYDPNMRIIISNTTEVGIVLVKDDDVHLSPPRSFPGKLLAFLHERFKAFNGDINCGMIVIPTELIIDNGEKLYSIIIELAKINKLEDAFITWLRTANHFCNSLVDRIVAGKLNEGDKNITEKKLGYSDELMIMAEPFHLWAIESDSEKAKEVLCFSKIDQGVIITGDIEKFRELKLRLLNGTHSFCCAIAILAGFETVKDAMHNEQISAFIKDLMMSEIATAIDGELISYSEAYAFAAKVMDRFRNPFLEHKWLSIALNYTSKMRTRNISLLQRYFNKKGKIPDCMALGFAAYLLFMKCTETKDGKYYGEVHGHVYNIEDNQASYFADKWMTNDTDQTLDMILANEDLWGADLSALNGFSQAIDENIRSIQQKGIMSAINSRCFHKTTA